MLRRPPLELSGRVRDLALESTKLAKRATTSDSETADDSLLQGYLNHPAGQSMHALFELLRREMVGSDPAGRDNRTVPVWFTRSVLEPMAQDSMALGVDAWIGLGRYYSLLLDFDPDSVRFVASHLRSEPSHLSIASLGFWSGYLWAPSVSSDALRQLLDAYRTHAPIVEQEGALAARPRNTVGECSRGYNRRSSVAGSRR